MNTHEEPGPILVTVPIPRDALTVVVPPPVLVSQKNVEAIVGVPAESYLRMLRSPDFNVTVIADGKLRLVNREAFVEWLSTHRKAPARSTVAAPSGTDDGASDILRALGGRPTKRGR